MALSESEYNSILYYYILTRFVVYKIYGGLHGSFEVGGRKKDERLEYTYKYLYINNYYH